MQLFIEPSLPKLYETHKTESKYCLDLFFPEDCLVPAKGTLTVDLKIRCELKKLVTFLKTQQLYKKMPFWVVTREDITKTPLRFVEGVKMIKSDYSKSILVTLDNISEIDFEIKCGEKLFKIVSPDLEPFDIVLLES